MSTAMAVDPTVASESQKATVEETLPAPISEAEVSSEPAATTTATAADPSPSTAPAAETPAVAKEEPESEPVKKKRGFFAWLRKLFGKEERVYKGRPTNPVKGKPKPK